MNIVQPLVHLFLLKTMCCEHFKGSPTPLSEYQPSVVKITSQVWISSWRFLFEKPHTAEQAMALIDCLWQVVCSFEGQEWLTASKSNIQSSLRAYQKLTNEEGGFQSAPVTLERELKEKKRAFSEATSSRRSQSELIHLSEPTAESAELVLLCWRHEAALASLYLGQRLESLEDGVSKTRHWTQKWMGRHLSQKPSKTWVLSTLRVRDKRRVILKQWFRPEMLNLMLGVYPILLFQWRDKERGSYQSLHPAFISTDAKGQLCRANSHSCKTFVTYYATRLEKDLEHILGAVVEGAGVV